MPPEGFLWAFEGAIKPQVTPENIVSQTTQEV